MPVKNYSRKYFGRSGIKNTNAVDVNSGNEQTATNNLQLYKKTSQDNF